MAEVTATPAPVNPTAPKAADPVIMLSQQGKPTEARPETAPEAKTETPKDPKFAARFAELTKKETQALKTAQQAKAERTAYEEAVKKDKEEIAAFQRMKADAKVNPDAFLKATYGDNWFDEMVRFRLEGAPPQDMMARAVDEKLAAFTKAQEDAVAAQTRAQQEAQTKREQEATQAFHAEALAHIQSRANDGAALISLLNAGKTVIEVIEAHYAATGKVMSYAEATDLTESHLLGEMEKALKVPKLAAKAREWLGAVAEQQKKEPAKWTSTPVTTGLTNKDGATTPSVTVSPSPKGEDKYKRGIDFLARWEASRK